MPLRSKIKWGIISKLKIQDLYFKFLITRNLLNYSGYSKSLQTKSSVTPAGNPSPWYTYPAIEYLETIDFAQMSAFEYGSGNSTLWWSSRVRYLKSMESDPGWHQRIKKELRAKPNVDYILSSNSHDYINESCALQSDIVIIDGDHRGECARFLCQNPNTNSLLIFDNADRYPKTIKYLSDSLHGWDRIDFSGFGPINTYCWTTSIFINKSSPKLKFGALIHPRAGLNSLSEEDY